MHCDKVVVILLLAGNALLALALQASSKGHAALDQLTHACDDKRQQIVAREQANTALASRVVQIKRHPALLEEQAREELGLIKPTETFYQVIEK